jgi:predicted ATPase
MVDYAVEDIVVLHLAGQASEERPAPYGSSTPGILDALGIDGETVSERVALLSSLSSLSSQGLVTEAVASVRGFSEKRTIYELTAAGHEHATAVRDRLADERITVHDGTAEQTVGLDDVERFAEQFRGDPLVGVLAALTDDDVLYLDDQPTQQYVDRDAEQNHFERALAETTDGQSRTILLSGDVGQGKTTLLEQFTATAHAEGAAILSGVCARTDATPYGPFRSMLADADFDADPFAPTGLDPDDEAALEARRQTLFSEFATAIDEQTPPGPTVVVIDDLQWADPGSLDLFCYLATGHAVDQLLLVGATRPEAVTGDGPLAHLLGAEGVTHCSVDPFDRSRTRDLVGTLVGTRDVPTDFVDQLHARTEGNPLFVTESVRHLLDDGAIDPEYGLYPSDRPDLVVPERIQDAIERRLEPLDDTGWRVLEAGAVIGRIVPLAVLEAVLDVPAPRLRDYVDLLVGSAVWEYETGSEESIRTAASTDEPADLPRMADGSGAVQFVHRSARSTVLDTISPDRKASLHLDVVEAILGTFDDRDDQYATVAAHYDRGGAETDAIEYYRRAGDRATDLFAHETAIEHYRNGLQIARDGGDTEQVCTLLERMGETYRILGDHDDARQMLEYVIERTEQPDVKKRVYHKLSAVCEDGGDFEAAVEYADAGLGLADLTDPDVATVRLLNAKGWGLLRQSDYDAALAAFEREADLADRIDNPTEQAQALYDRGTGRLTKGELDCAQELLTEAVEANADHGRTQTHIYALNDLGIVYWKQGEYVRALETYEECYDRRKEFGDVQGECTSCVNLGGLHATLGNRDQAREYYERGLEIAQRIGARHREAGLYHNLAEQAFRDGDPETALEYAARTRSIYADLGDRSSVGEADHLQFFITFYHGDLETAERAARQCLETGRDIGDSELTVSGVKALGDIARERETLGATEEYYSEALELARENGQTVQVACVHRQLTWLYALLGDLDSAREHVDALENWDTQVPRPADHYLGLGIFYRADGDLQRSTRALETGLEQATDADEPIKQVQYSYELARTAAATGDTERARSLAEDALATAGECAIDLYSEKVSTLLADLKDRPPRPDRQPEQTESTDG